MRNSLNIALAVWLLSAAPGAAAETDFELPATTVTPRLDFTAERMEYDASSETVLLSGNAVITDSTFTIRADVLRVDLDHQVFYAPVPLEVSNGATGFKAQSGSFDYSGKVGSFDGVSGKAAPWAFYGRQTEFKNGRYKLKSARVTSCDREPPHYHFNATRLTLIPNGRIVAWNDVFFLGPVPLFYVPVYFRSLKPDPLVVTKVHVGYDQRNGAELQTDNRIRISTGAYDRFYVDYYTRQGLGLGDEVNYRRRDGSRGTVYGYWIRERTLDLDRWTVLGDVWQRLGEKYFMQGRLETASDPDFNNAYFRSHQIRVAPTLTNSVAVVRQTQVTTTRMSYSRLDSRDPARPLDFVRTAESAPRLDFSAAPFKVLGIPVLNNVSAFADHSIDLSRNFYQNTAGGTWSLTQTLKLAKNLTLVPAVGMSEQYQDKALVPTSSGTVTRFDQFTGRYFTQADLRLHSFLGDSTAGHRYTRRFETNSLREDVTAADRGEEQNLATGEHSYQPTLKSRWKVSSGYDLRRNPRTAAAPKRFDDRLQPIVGEFSWVPLPLLGVLAREQMRVGPGHQSVILAADYGLPGENRAGVSLSQNAADKGRAFAGTTFGWLPKRSSWTFEGALRFELNGEGSLPRLSVDHLRLFEKELAVRKVWHDFVTRLSFRERPGGVREYLVRVDLRFGKGMPENRRQDWEQEFYPWREGLKEK